MTDQPRVSVIIPVYNQAHYLKRTLDSVLAQTYRNFEVIVVDDGSSDNPRAVCAQYGDRVQYIQQENQGVCAARNTGLQAASGEFVQFLDSDDFIIPDKLNAQATLMMSDPRVGIVNGGWWLTDQDGTVYDCVTPWDYAPVLNLETWLLWKPVFPGAMLLRKSVVEQAGAFDPAFTQAEDVDLILRMMLTGCEARWLKRPTVYYRQHARNTVKNSIDQTENMVRVLEKFFSLPDLPRHITKMAPRVQYYTLLWNCANLYTEGHTEAVKRYLKQAINKHHKEAFQVVTDFLLQIHKNNGTTIEYDPMHALLSEVVEGEPWTAVVPFSTVLNVWVNVMVFYTQPEAKLTEIIDFSMLHNLSARQIVKTLAALIIADQRLIPAADLKQLWQDMQAAGLIAAQDHAEVITLYLTSVSKAVFSRQWKQAVVFFGHALRNSTHPRAVPPWYRFFRSAFEYALQHVARKLSRGR